MKLARQLERRLERLVDGMAARIFKGGIRPIDVATRLVREADLAVVAGAAGPEIPNVYDIAVNPVDIDGNASLGAATRRFAEVVADAAADQGWRLPGPVEVRLLADGTVPRGDIRCRTAAAPAALPAWAVLESRLGAPLPVAHNRAVIGRGTAGDVVIPHTQVSRRHALLWREGGRVMLADLGSANGTSCNGEHVGDGSEVRSGDALGFGPVTFTFRTA